MEDSTRQEQAPVPSGGSIIIEDPKTGAAGKKNTSKTKKDAHASKDGDGAGDGNNEGSNAKARKRTKTGCLTCRKRRIKCGEERPTCSNCVKSKRNCEGYTPRVIFKDPLGAYRPTVGITQTNGAHFQNHIGHTGSNGSIIRVQGGPTGQAALPPIAPRPSPPIQQHGFGQATPIMPPGASTEYGLFGYTFDGQTYGQAVPDTEVPLTGHTIPEQHRNSFTNDSHIRPDSHSLANGCHEFKQHEFKQQPELQHRNTGESDSGIDMAFAGYSSHSSTSSGGAPAVHFPPQTQEFGLTPVAPVDPLSRRSLDSLPQALFSPPPPPPHSNDVNYSEQWSNAGQQYHSKWQWPQPSNTEHGSFVAAEYREDINDPSLPIYQAFSAPQQMTTITPEVPQFPGEPTTYAQVPTTNLNLKSSNQPMNVRLEHCVAEPDEDYWDVSSDEEITGLDGSSSEAQPHNFGLMIALSANQHGKSFRSLTNFLLEPNVLATYRPSYAASPLRDPQTALVFCHFITATAPTLSVSERHIINTASMFTGHPVPRSQQGLWTYTMPMKALHHQGLLHAMLALASLHIAKLQKSSATPSLKHYHYALRKVAKSLGNPSKRHDIATLGATLLLGFYEVTTAEHNKWNSHLAGAKQLIVETDFVNTAKRINTYKTQVEMAQQHQFLNGFMGEYGQSYTQQNQSYDFPGYTDGLDENLISNLMGWKTSYDQFGQIVGGHKDSLPSSTKPVTQADVDKFEAQCDLFWWYAKQDMFQSIISGNRLLLPYERWSHCAPRAPISRLDAVYGTMDHLILLMGRIADFAGKDLSRKQTAATKAQQMKAQSPTNAMSQQPSLPAFAMPTDANFNPAFSMQSPAQDLEFETSTTIALNEWLSISHALDIFEESLGPAFAALSPEHMTPLSTPFGPALYYRTYGIACIWSLYYTGRIISTRVHPSMPPAAMVAAGMAAPRTAVWANLIGRITAGIQPISTTVPLNPAHGAALMDACMGTFHAGVQYQDAAQRGWTIKQLRDIARLTGWQTSALIASGCERAWQKAYENGRGPKYERTMNAEAKDDRVAGRSREAERGPPKDNNDRRFVKVNPGTRVYWAMGILSAEEDMAALSIG